jgi:hypothetical protein
MQCSLVSKITFLSSNFVFLGHQFTLAFVVGDQTSLCRESRHNSFFFQRRIGPSGPRQISRWPCTRMNRIRCRQKSLIRRMLQCSCRGEDLRHNSRISKQMKFLSPLVGCIFVPGRTVAVFIKFSPCTD